MNDFPLNIIIKSEFGWSCNVFGVDVINIGGVFLENFNTDALLNNDAFNYRYYKKTKKIMVSGKDIPDYKYCALNFQYKMWKCLICKKLNKISDSNCFCETYSICWAPMDYKIIGILLSNEYKFLYHFDNNSLDQIIL